MNRLNPIIAFPTSKCQMVDPKFKKRMSLFFKKINLINDDNLLYEVNDLTESFAFERMETDFTTENTSSLFEVMVYSSRETQKMTRRYEKLYKMLANLGGISYFMVFLEYLIVMSVREYCLMKKIVNFLYSFPKKELKPEKTEKRRDSELDILKNKLSNEKMEEIHNKIVIPIHTTAVQTPPRKAQLSDTNADLFQSPSLNIDQFQTQRMESLFYFQNEAFSALTRRKSNVLPPKVVKEDEEPQTEIELNKKINDEEVGTDRKSPEIGQTENAEKVSTGIKIPIYGTCPNIRLNLNPVQSLESHQRPLKIKRSSFFRHKKKTLETFEQFADYQNTLNKEQKLDISFWEYIKLKMNKICKCIKMNSVQKMFVQAEEKAFQEMDFFMILRKLQEIEKIKLILFSPQQLKLFNLLSKPMIFEEDKICDETRRDGGFKMSMMLENSKKLSQLGDKNDVLEYYQNLREKKGSKIDERLLALVDQSIEKFSCKI